MCKRYPVNGDRIYVSWLLDDDLFGILDESRPLRARCHQMTMEIPTFRDGTRRALGDRGFYKIDAIAGRRLAQSPTLMHEIPTETFRRWCLRMYVYRNLVSGNFLNRLFEGDAR